MDLNTKIEEIPRVGVAYAKVIKERDFFSNFRDTLDYLWLTK